MLNRFSVTYETPAQLLEMVQFAVSKGFVNLSIDQPSTTLTIEADIPAGVGFFDAPVELDEILSRITLQEYVFDPLANVEGLGRLDLLQYVACSLVKRGEIPIVCLAANVNDLADSLLEQHPFQRRLCKIFNKPELLIGVAASFKSFERISGSADSRDRVILLTANNPWARQDECTRAWTVVLPPVPTTRIRSIVDV